MNKNAAQTICQCGLLTALAVLLQSAPVFLPFLGMAISPLATLPVALAATRSGAMGVSSLAAATLILCAVSPQEAAVFVCSTGLLGFNLGLLHSRRMALVVPAAGLALYGGILALGYVFSIPVMGYLTPQAPSTPTALILLAFSLLSAALWTWLMRLVTNFLVKLKSLKGSRKR